MSKRFLYALFAGWIAVLISGCAHGQVGYYRFSEEVTRASAKDAVAAIHKAEHDHVKVLIIDINTPGGSVYDGYEISKAIENAKVRIVCVADGEAASMGFYILQSCPVRYMTKRTVLMAHNPSFHLNESMNPSQLAQVLEALKALSNAMAEHCASRLKMTVEAYQKRIDGQDWDMNWKEALAIGAVDYVVNSVREVALLYR